jgi:hypothetical protein
VISLLQPTSTLAEGAPYVTVQPDGGVEIDSATPLASATVCLARSVAYFQYEDGLVCPAAESLTAVGVGCAWAPSQTAAGGGCLTFTGAASAAAYAGLLWQTQVINGAPFGSVTPGARRVDFVVTNADGEASETASAVVVVARPAGVEPATCPALQAPPAAAPLVVLPAQLAGNTGVRLLSGATVTAGSGLPVNAHARIVGGCVAGDVLALDYASGAPLTIAVTFYPDTCDATMVTATAA